MRRTRENAVRVDLRRDSVLPVEPLCALAAGYLSPRSASAQPLQLLSPPPPQHANAMATTRDDAQNAAQHVLSGELDVTRDNGRVTLVRSEGQLTVDRSGITVHVHGRGGSTKPLAYEYANVLSVNSEKVLRKSRQLFVRFRDGHAMALKAASGLDLKAEWVRRFIENRFNETHYAIDSKDNERSDGDRAGAGETSGRTTSGRAAVRSRSYLESPPAKSLRPAASRTPSERALSAIASLSPMRRTQRMKPRESAASLRASEMRPQPTSSTPTLALPKSAQPASRTTKRRRESSPAASESEVLSLSELDDAHGASGAMRKRESATQGAPERPPKSAAAAGAFVAAAPTKSSTASRRTASSASDAYTETALRVTTRYAARRERDAQNAEAAAAAAAAAAEAAVADSPTSGKPSNSLSPLQGSALSTVAPRSATGMENLGNTCYVSVVMQSLLSLRVFVAHLRLSQRRLAAPPAPSSRRFLHGFLKLASQQAECSDARVVCNPREVLLAFVQYARRFSGSHQEDAQEFLLEALTLLEHEMTPPEGDGSVRLPQDSCAVAKSFSTVVERRFTCEQCAYVGAAKYELQKDLSLDLVVAPPDAEGGEPKAAKEDGEGCEKKRGGRRRSSKTSLATLLDNYFADESVVRTCDRCGHAQAQQSLHLALLPQVLILHLKRTQNNGAGKAVKADHRVRVPMYIDLGKHACDNVLGPDMFLPPSYLDNEALVSSAEGEDGGSVGDSTTSTDNVASESMSDAGTAPAQPAALAGIGAPHSGVNGVADAQGTRDAPVSGSVAADGRASEVVVASAGADDRAEKLERKVRALVTMGYDEVRAREALSRAALDIERAAVLLTNGGTDSPDALVSDLTARAAEAVEAKKSGEAAAPPEAPKDDDDDGRPPPLTTRGFDVSKYVEKVMTRRSAREDTAANTAAAPAARRLSSRYRLQCIIRHQGASASSGHYLADIRDPTTGLWHEFNDERVTDVKDNQPYTDRKRERNAYVFLYVHQGYIM